MKGVNLKKKILHLISNSYKNQPPGNLSNGIRIKKKEMSLVFILTAALKVLSFNVIERKNW